MNVEREIQIMAGNLDDIVLINGCGTTSMDGFCYDGDPAEGGRPLVGLVFLDADNKMGRLLGLTLEHAAGLIAELTHRVDMMGYGVALRALIDQHAAGANEYARTGQSELATGMCGSCGARPHRNDTGMAVVDHLPGCPIGGTS